MGWGRGISREITLTSEAYRICSKGMASPGCLPWVNATENNTSPAMVVIIK
jgi:hypothetical protein